MAITVRNVPQQPATRSDQLLRDFKKFHANNPWVWELFERYTQQLIDSGRTRYSADAVLHRIRWHVVTETKGEEVKINDHYSAFYGRMFLAKHPQHLGFFSLRLRPSTGKGAYDLDLTVFNSGPPGDEMNLFNVLKGL